MLKFAAVKTVENDPDINLMHNHDGTTLRLPSAPLIRSLAKGLGVTFNIVMPEDNEYGFKERNGKWTGIIGMIETGEADLSHTLTITNERKEVVNFSYPLHVAEVTFMTDKPEQVSKSFAILDVFSREVWIGIGLYLILVSLFLFMLLKRKKPYSTILVNTFGYLLEQAFSFQARQRNTELLLLFCFLGIAVLTGSYKAVLLSVMTFPRMIGIRDISDLTKAAQENSVMCMTHKGSVLWQYGSTDERLKLISMCLKRSQTKSLYSFEDFFNYPSKKAFIGEKFFISKYGRDYVISDESFSLSFIAIAYSKDFCCPKKLESVVHRITAAGLYTKIFRDRDFKFQLQHQSILNDSINIGTGWKNLTLIDFKGAFLVLIVGHMCSLVIFLAEIISKKMTQ